MSVLSKFVVAVVVGLSALAPVPATAQSGRPQPPRQVVPPKPKLWGVYIRRSVSERWAFVGQLATRQEADQWRDYYESQGYQCYIR